VQNAQNRNLQILNKKLIFVLFGLLVEMRCFSCYN